MMVPSMDWQFSQQAQIFMQIYTFAFKRDHMKQHILASSALRSKVNVSFQTAKLSSIFQMLFETLVTLLYWCTSTWSIKCILSRKFVAYITVGARRHKIGVWPKTRAWTCCSLSCPSCATNYFLLINSTDAPYRLKGSEFNMPKNVSHTSRIVFCSAFQK